MVVLVIIVISLPDSGFNQFVVSKYQCKQKHEIQNGADTYDEDFDHSRDNGEKRCLSKMQLGISLLHEFICFRDVNVKHDDTSDTEEYIEIPQKHHTLPHFFTVVV